jgi:hypothetical protein
LRFYPAITDEQQLVKLSFEQLKSYVAEAREGEILSDGRLHIVTAEGKHFYLNIPTAKAKTTFPIEGGYAVGRKILHEKGRNGASYYLCIDGKIRELTPPRSCT